MENKSITKLYINNLDADSREEVLRQLASKLYENNLVKKEFLESIIQREQEYPTGLPSSYPLIAIPHTDYSLVNSTSIVVATLKKPVDFYSMENPKEVLGVSIVIMLAISEPKGQINMLQKIVEIISDEKFRCLIVGAKNENELATIIASKL